MNINDLEALRRLTHLYAWHIDHFELEPLTQLWTEDAVMDETGVGLGSYQGRTAIHDYFAQVFAVMKTQVHFTSNFILQELSGDQAKGTCYYLVEGVVQGGGTVRGTGYYLDDYTRTAEGWRFQSRRVFGFNPPELGAYESGMQSA